MKILGSIATGTAPDHYYSKTPYDKPFLPGRQALDKLPEVKTPQGLVAKIVGPKEGNLRGKDVFLLMFHTAYGDFDHGRLLPLHMFPPIMAIAHKAYRGEPISMTERTKVSKHLSQRMQFYWKHAKSLFEGPLYH